MIVLTIHPVNHEIVFHSRPKLNINMRIVIDTNIFVSALRSNLGASYAIISQLPSDKFQIVLTIPLYLEYQDVLTRPEHMSGKSSKDDIINFLRYMQHCLQATNLLFMASVGKRSKR